MTLLAQVATVRKRGYAYSDQLTDGVSAIAILLSHLANDCALTVGIGGPTNRVKPRVPELLALIRKLIETHLPAVLPREPSCGAGVPATPR